MKCESSFVNSRTRKKEIVDCAADVVSFWREDQLVFGIRISHSRNGVLDLQELNLSLTPAEAVHLAKGLFDEACRRIIRDAERKNKEGR